MRAFLISVITILVTTASLHAQQRDLNLSSNSPEIRDLVYDGIDVSSYQEDIDWSATASDKNIKFVYVKATEGTSYKSRHYQYNIENARKHGLRVGSYHFYRPNIPVIKQFQNFTSIVKLDEQDLVPLIDIETKGGLTGAQVADSVLAFARLLERHYGCRPMIYTGSSFYNSYLRGRLAGYKLFIARYSKYPPRLADATWTLWQFSERGRIAGIDSYVDLCRFNTGCNLNSILIKGRRPARATTRTTAVPPRKVAPKPQQQQVPLSKKEMEKQRKAQEKAEKQARKEAEKAREQARKQAETEAKAKAKREAEAQKAAEKKREQDRKALEQQQARQKQEQKQALKDAERAREKARKQEAARKAQQQSANQKAKSQGKRVNQSSADNDDDVYMPIKKR